MSNAIALRETDTMAEWETIRDQAAVLVRSGFLPQSIKTPEQALAIILTGRELGIGTMTALNNINVIQGKPTVPPQLMLALIHRSGQLEDMAIEASKDGASCLMKRKGKAPYIARFGPAEAAALGLSGKDNYKKQPATMYKWRAVADACRFTFSDVIQGLYTPDEMGAHVDAEGEVIEMRAERTENVFANAERHVETMRQEFNQADTSPPPFRAETPVHEGIRKVFIPPADEPEPVRPVLFEGAQPTSGTEWPKGKGMGAAIFAKCKALGFTPVDLANYIQLQFKLAVSDEPQSALDALDNMQLKALDQALAGEFNNRGAK